MGFIHLIIFLAIGGKIAAGQGPGGERIFVNDAPYFVSIRNASRHVCGGVLIQNDLVLTSSRCVRYERITVVSGVDENNPHGTVHELKPMRDTSTLGVALATLSNPILHNSVADSADIPFMELSYDEIVHLITFRPEINELRRYEVKLAPWFRCSDDQNMLCATRRSDSDMHDDEIGSPLVRYGTLVGIAVGKESLNDDYDVYLDFHKYWENPAS